MQKKRAHMRDIGLAEHRRNQWRVGVEAGTTLAEALDPGFLWHGQDRIRAGDFVELLHEDHKFFVRLLVAKLDHETQSIVCRTVDIRDWGDEELPRSDLAEARIEHKGASAKWCVLLGNQYLERGFRNEAEARAWLDERRAGRKPVEAAA